MRVNAQQVCVKSPGIGFQRNSPSGFGGNFIGG